jgi:hypothetical protein
MDCSACTLSQSLGGAVRHVPGYFTLIIEEDIVWRPRSVMQAACALTARQGELCGGPTKLSQGAILGSEEKLVCRR